MEFHHIPVLLTQCLEALAIQPDGTYLDGTVGGAGHSKEIAARLHAGRLICLDQDPDAIETARARLAGLPAVVIQANFRCAAAVLDSAGVAARCWTLAYPAINWMRFRGGSRTRGTRRWICA